MPQKIDEKNGKIFFCKVMIFNKLKKYVSKNVYEIFTKHEFCYIRASTFKIDIDYLDVAVKG